MTLDPLQRRFQEPPQKKKMRDVDSVARVRKMKVLGFSLYGGLPLGAAAGFAAGHPFLGLLLGPVLIGTVTMVLAGMGGRGVSFLFIPPESSAPRKTEHSRAEALAVRGEFQAGIAAYQDAIVDFPEDGEAYLRIARIYRDKVRNPEEALLWFRRSLAEAVFSESQELLTRREMAELIIHHLQEPRRAAPDLARLAETFPSSQTGKWAKEELARIKKDMAGEG